MMVSWESHLREKRWGENKEKFKDEVGESTKKRERTMSVNSGHIKAQSGRGSGGGERASS